MTMPVIPTTPTDECVAIRVNGRIVRLPKDDDRTLVEWLPEAVGPVAAHPACDGGHCGACAVVLDGVPTKSCTVPIATLAGAEIQTLDAYQHDAYDLAPLVAAMDEPSVFQCGYCKSAFFFAAKALLEENPKPKRADIQSAFNGLLCRCTGYQAIVSAVEVAAQVRLDGGTLPKITARPLRVSPDAPRTVAEACHIVQVHPDAHWCAGGQNLVPRLNHCARPKPLLVDIAGIAELRRITLAEDRLIVGAGCTHAGIATSEQIRSVLPELARLAGNVGDIYVRSRGTLGGAIASMVRNGSYPPFLIATDAHVLTTDRRVPALQWFETCAIETESSPRELVLAIEFPTRWQLAHRAFRLRPARPALIGVTGADDGHGHLRIAIAGFATRPFLMPDALKLLTIARSDAEDTEISILLGIQARNDVEASSAYRLAILRQLLLRLPF